MAKHIKARIGRHGAGKFLTTVVLDKGMSSENRQTV